MLQGQRWLGLATLAPVLLFVIKENVQDIFGKNIFAPKRFLNPAEEASNLIVFVSATLTDYLPGLSGQHQTAIQSDECYYHNSSSEIP